MMYTLYAITRVTSNKINICEYSDLEFLKQVSNYFSSSDYLQKYVITTIDENNNEILVYQKELEQVGIKKHL